MTKYEIRTMDEFAELLAGILKTDRWVFIGCDGDMGEGKSCFTSQLAFSLSKKTKRHFSYADNMTFQRKELKKWVDGDEKGKGRKKEYSAILADEVISMFFKRNWFDSEQIDGIELLNKCRDRHLCILGNIPNFWDLDSAIYSIITFWVHIDERGVAWVFEKDRNPFASDKWHKKANEKLFAKQRHPYKCVNFVCEIHFDDWAKEDKNEYYSVRNVKRVQTEGQRAKVEKYKHIKSQRDALMRLVFDIKPELTLKDVADVTGLSFSAVSLIKNRA